MFGNASARVFSTRNFASTASPLRRCSAVSARCGFGSWHNRRGTPHGPIPPATSSAASDTLEMPDSKPPWATTAQTQEFAHSACRCGGLLPARQPAPPDLRNVPSQASDASPAVLFCAKTVRKQPHIAPGRFRTGEKQSPRHRNRCTAPSYSADCRSLGGIATALLADALLPHPFARILPQVPWLHLPLSLPDLWSRDAWHLPSTCRAGLGERL